MDGLPAGVTVKFTRPSPTSVSFEVFNGGTSPICTWAGVMAGSERQAGNQFLSPATTTQGTVIQPPATPTGDDAFGAYNLNLAPGGTVVVTVGTKQPHTPGAGALTELVLCDAPATLYQEIVEGPTAPPLPPPPTPCDCLSLKAHIDPKSFDLRDERLYSTRSVNWMRLSFQLTWTMKCTGGSGGCDGQLRLEAPERKDRLFTTTWGGPSVSYEREQVSIKCEGNCEEPQKGTYELFLWGNRGLAERERGKTVHYVPIAIERTCGTKTLVSTHLRIDFDTEGRIDLSHSYLG